MSDNTDWFFAVSEDAWFTDDGDDFVSDGLEFRHDIGEVDDGEPLDEAQLFEQMWG